MTGTKQTQRATAEQIQQASQILSRLEPGFVTTLLHKVNRGTELITVMYIDMTNDKVTTGEWHPASDLPADIIDTQKKFINLAVQTYEGNRNI